MLIVLTVAIAFIRSTRRTMGMGRYFDTGYGMGWTHWWVHGGYRIERMPHQSSSSSHLYDQDRGKANARTVEYYVTVMTDATHELIVIRADDNLNSRDWI